MIKEHKKKKKKQEITLKQELLNYARTACISFLSAALFTVLLSFHARSEMIKNLYTSKEERMKIEHKIAKQIVSHTDLTATLHDKSYVVVMQVGDLYDAAGDLQKAEYAYHIAVQKSPSDKFLAHSKLAIVLISQDKISDAIQVIDSVEDSNNLSLVRFKTRAYLVLGDKYYSKGKFLKAATAYENAYYYYSTLSKKDKFIRESIQNRMVNAYIETANVIVRNGYNSDAVRFLKKALYYAPNNYKIQYRLAIVYSDLDPIRSIEYFEPLLDKIPQEIDYNIYSKALMKAANIMDISGNGIKAKYYRYKVHSIDLFINNKVVYKDDIDIILNSFSVKKVLFSYKLKSVFTLKNVSSVDVKKLYMEVVLRKGEDKKESSAVVIASKKQPLYSNGGEKTNIEFRFGNNIYTKKELSQYYIDVYLYKEPKYKTLVYTMKIPTK